MKKTLIGIAITIAAVFTLVTGAFAADQAAAKGDLLDRGKPTLGSFAILGEYLLGMTYLDEEQMFAADMNGDGNVTIADFAILGNILLNNNTETNAAQQAAQEAAAQQAANNAALEAAAWQAYEAAQESAIPPSSTEPFVPPYEPIWILT